METERQKMDGTNYIMKSSGSVCHSNHNTTEKTMDCLFLKNSV